MAVAQFWDVRHYQTVMKIASLTLLALALVTSCTRTPSNATASRSQQLASQSAAALNAKDYSQAQSLAAQATHIDPQFAEAWVGYGMASVRLGQTDRAREAYEHALSLLQTRHGANPSDANQVLQQIFVLSLLGRSGEAEAMLKQAQAGYPNNQQISKLAENISEAGQGWASWSVEAK